jgi:cytochrome c peroxidase
MRYVWLLHGTLVFGLIVGLCSVAEARKPYMEQFKDLYIKDPADPATTPNEKKLAESFEKAQCNTCHLGKQKKDRNIYGEELAKKIGKKNEKNNQTIKKAIEGTGKELSDPKNPMSPKFGDLIKDGKLPAG